MLNPPLTPGVDGGERTQTVDTAKDAASAGEMAGPAADAVGAIADHAAASAGLGIQGLGDRFSGMTEDVDQQDEHRPIGDHGCWW